LTHRVTHAHFYVSEWVHSHWLVNLLEPNIIVLGCVRCAFGISCMRGAHAGGLVFCPVLLGWCSIPFVALYAFLLFATFVMRPISSSRSLSTHINFCGSRSMECRKIADDSSDHASDTGSVISLSSEQETILLYFFLLWARVVNPDAFVRSS